MDPEIEVRPALGQVDDLVEQTRTATAKGGRVLVTTITKKMAEELSGYLSGLDMRTKYIHSEIDALERVSILRELRLAEFDVLVGVNLLREGLDLPEVTLVAVMDADKEGPPFTDQPGPDRGKGRQEQCGKGHLLRRHGNGLHGLGHG